MIWYPQGVGALNAPLVGEPGSRMRLETPAAVLDLPAFERNLARLHATCRAGGLAVRPHAKSHKCGEIGRRQMVAGASGLCCAKPGELLALAGAGLTDLLLTAPLASPRKIAALASAAAMGTRIGFAVDRLDLIAALGAAAQAQGTRFDILVDLDTGLRRSGVDDPAQAVALARAASDHPALAYAGVQAYQGRQQHIVDFAARRAAVEESNAILRGFLDALREAGLPPAIVSGGGTGSHALDAAAGLFTEIQAGSYVFMDEGYAGLDFEGQGPGSFATALRVAVTVIGHSSLGFAITDGGSKSFALDGPAPRVFLREGQGDNAGEREVGRIEWCGDEFGRILPAPGEATRPIGTVVECSVPHCDPTINLHDVLHVVEGDRLVAQWAVEGRGRAD